MPLKFFEVVLNSIFTGMLDVLESLTVKCSWLYLGLQDIKQRYRRSVLGPWWLTISTGILVLVLGLLWSNVFIVDIHKYMPFFATGLVVWTFISGFLTEACIAFTQFEGLIKQQKAYFFSFILRVYIRHAIIFAHNFLIVYLVIVFVGSGFSLMSINGISRPYFING